MNLWEHFCSINQTKQQMAWIMCESVRLGFMYVFVCMCVHACTHTHDLCVRVWVSVRFYTAAVSKNGQAGTLIASVGVRASSPKYSHLTKKEQKKKKKQSIHPAVMTTPESSILLLQLRLQHTSATVRPHRQLVHRLISVHRVQQTGSLPEAVTCCWCWWWCVSSCACVRRARVCLYAFLYESLMTVPDKVLRICVN